MKKIYLFMALIAMFASCKNRNANTTTNTGRTVTNETTVTETRNNSSSNMGYHNARNSVDVAGTYKGTLPTASGNGMEVTIILTDSTFRENVKYIGHPENDFETTGRYSWDNTGMIITFEGEEAPNKYRVEENRLIHLDIDGNVITGDMADLYILRKQ